jgi:enoyl-CoA hydratase/carnithine racemase
VADFEISSTQFGPVRIIVWNREQKRNAFTSKMANSLKLAVQEASEDPGVGVILLDPGASIFSAGWDLDELIQTRTEGSEKSDLLIESGRMCLREIAESPCFVVSVCRGAALGFGISILANSDYVLAQSSARFALPELDAGVIPSSVLGDLIAKYGISRALKWAILGNISHPEALNSGLVNVLLPNAEIDSEIERIIVRFNKIGTKNLRATVKLAREMSVLNGEEMTRHGDNFAKFALASTENGTD